MAILVAIPVAVVGTSVAVNRLFRHAKRDIWPSRRVGVRLCILLIRRVSELASGLTRNQMPSNGLWVRIPCPPLLFASGFCTGLNFEFRDSRDFGRGPPATLLPERHALLVRHSVTDTTTVCGLT